MKLFAKGEVDSLAGMDGWRQWVVGGGWWV